MRRLIAAALAATLLFGCSKEQPLPVDTYIYEPVLMTHAYIALAEKPDAARALLIGNEAKSLKPVLENAGVQAFTAPAGKFDLVIVACSDMSAESCAKAASYLTENGVFVWMMNVDGVTAGQFRKKIQSFTMEGVHLWMPGSTRWALTGRKTGRTIKLSAMLDVFVRGRAFADMAKAHCAALPELFANFAGTKENIMPAFAALRMSDVIGPENFITREVMPVEWVSREELDADIADSVMAEMRSMQTVRRMVLEGNLLASVAASTEDEEKATEQWARAMLRNPNDLMMLERLDRLDRNARGFLEVGKLLPAMKCYETMVLIRPNDAVAVHNFGMCLKKLGKLDIAKKVLSRAKLLSERTKE